MASKPDFLKWVPNDDAAKIVDPGTTKKANGFLYLEKPPFQYVNYLFNRIFKWLRGLQGVYAQVVVGSSSQVTDYLATHTINDLNDTNCPVGTRILLLEGTHTLTANLTLTNADLVIESENNAAIVNLASLYKLSLTGARARGSMRFSNVTAGADALTVNGASSRMDLYDIAITSITTASSVLLNVSGTSAAIKLRNASVLTETELTNHKATRNIWTKAQDVSQVTLTDAANIATDASLSNVFLVTLGGNRALDNPSNLQAGQTIIWNIRQDATGGRTLSFGTMFKFPAGMNKTIDATISAKNSLVCEYDGTDLLCTLANKYE